MEQVSDPIAPRTAALTICDPAGLGGQLGRVETKTDRVHAGRNLFVGSGTERTAVCFLDCPFSGKDVIVQQILEASKVVWRCKHTCVLSYKLVWDRSGSDPLRQHQPVVALLSHSLFSMYLEH